jgi:hypothetical protein
MTKGEVSNFALNEANVDDQQTPQRNLGQTLWRLRLRFQNLFEMLFVDGMHLITKIRNNMNNTLMNINDKILLRKRALIETINDELKNIYQIEHSRHRSIVNFLCNTIAGLVAYSFLLKNRRLIVNLKIPDSWRPYRSAKCLTSDSC